MFGTKKLGGKQALIIHVGGASVGAALVHMGPVPEIAHVSRVAFEGGDAAGLPARVEAALESLLATYPNLAPTAVHVVLGAPWHQAQIRTVHSASPKPAPITPRIVAERIAHYQGEVAPAAGRIDVEAVAFEVRINGYPTSMRSAVTGTTLDINLYESEADSATITTLTRAIEKHTKAPLTWHTFPLVAAVAVRAITAETSFAIADCDAAVTDLMIIEDDACVYRASFPVGTTGIERAVGTDGPARLALLERGELSLEDAAQVRAAAAPAVESWQKELSAALTASADHAPIARTVYLVSDSPARERIADSACQGPLGLACVSIEAPLVQKLVAVGENATYDVPLSLAAIFFHTRAARGVVYSP